jgi:hypothetical protein
MNIRGVQVQIPPQAQARLDALQVQRDLALASQQGLQSRLGMIDDHAVDLRQRVLETRDHQAARFNVLSRLLSSCNQFLFTLRLPKGYCLEPCDVDKGLTQGERDGNRRGFGNEVVQKAQMLS